MITTQSFPNVVTSAPKDEEMKRNSLTKEDLEGKVKNNTSNSSSPNGGKCQNIKL